MMLSKFSDLKLEDAYMFISEFKEVCAMMNIQQLSNNAIKLRFISFSLRDNAKKLYSLATNSITTWTEFVTDFLKKFFPMHKTARIQSEIGTNFVTLTRNPSGDT